MKRFFILFQILAITTIVLAQQVSISTEKVIIDGEKFYVHTVEQGQTLYGISKAYEVDITILEELNPGVVEGLKLGETIKVPVIEIQQDGIVKDEVNFIYHEVKKKETVYSLTKQYDISEETFYEYNPMVLESGLKTGNEIIIPRKTASSEYKYDFSNQPKDTINYYYHVVAEGETLFSIARQYDLSRFELKRVNTEVDWNKLKLGQDIAIPIENVTLIEWPETIHDSTDTEVQDSMLILPDSLQVIMLLPFNIFANNKQLYNQSFHNKEMFFYPLSEVILDFYAGSLIALDSLDKLGTKMSVKIVDIGTDTAVLSRIINEGSLDDVQVIIGPVFSNQTALVEKYRNENSLLINPFTDCQDVDIKQGKVCLSPSNFNSYQHIASHCSARDSNNYIIISDKIDEDVISITNEFRRVFEDNDTIENINIKQLAFEEGEVKALKSVMSESLNNVVIVPPHKEPYVARIMAKLCQVEDVRIQLIGSESWLSYNSVEPSYFSKLNFTYTSPFYIAYDSLLVQNFVEEFREVFYTEPGKFSFIAFDLLLNIETLFASNSSILSGNSIDPLNVQGISSFYKFCPSIPSGAIVNTNLYLYKFNQNFEIDIIHLDSE